MFLPPSIDRDIECTTAILLTYSIIITSPSTRALHRMFLDLLLPQPGTHCFCRGNSKRHRKEDEKGTLLKATWAALEDGAEGNAY